jgi:hypothetical protein
MEISPLRPWQIFDSGVGVGFSSTTIIGVGVGVGVTFSSPATVNVSVGVGVGVALGLEEGLHDITRETIPEKRMTLCIAFTLIFITNLLSHISVYI